MLARYVDGHARDKRSSRSFKGAELERGDFLEIPHEIYSKISGKIRVPKHRAKVRQMQARSFLKTNIFGVN